MEMTLDLSAIFELEVFDHEAYDSLKKLAFAGGESINRFVELLTQLEQETESGTGDVTKAALKLGMSYLLLGSIERSEHWLQKADDVADKFYYLGQAYREQKRYQDSIQQFELAAQKGWDKTDCDMQRAESYVLLEELDKALDILSGISEEEELAQWHFVKGRYSLAIGDLDRAIEELEHTLDIDEHHALATFHLAYLLHLHGVDERAKELYIRATGYHFVHVNTLMNLAVIYEDDCEYDKAADCLRRVLAVDPNHGRAQLYLKDVLSAGQMYIDEQQIMDTEKRNAVLDIPVSDFELSVRSRNCLKKMNIHTLGDLLRTTEMELLSYKNFGETSLKEIRAMLTQKGLALGQLSQDKRQGPQAQVPIANPVASQAMIQALAGSDVNPDVLNKPVSVLELSVRSRKCIQLLGITTVGELAVRSEAELMGSRNFGQTSLEEIKSCLAQFGLSLRES
ncbi:MAG: tetratricopeptide repeat protein [Phycisphaerales bacterium]|nr:tetratricopeptide repeat protein [Phycisphaerales bacterium]